MNEFDFKKLTTENELIKKLEKESEYRRGYADALIWFVKFYYGEDKFLEPEKEVAENE